MYLMPVSRNILTGASLVPSTHRYEPAFQPDNLLDFANPGKPCLGLGAIRTTYVHIDFKEGGASCWPRSRRPPWRIPQPCAPRLR